MSEVARTFHPDSRAVESLHLTLLTTALIISTNNPPENLETDLSNYRFIQLDVFTQEPFAGNPLAVFPEAEGLTDEQMMKIAREMNLSETVFVLKPPAKSTKSADGESTKNEVEPRDAAGEKQSEQSEESDVLRRLRIFTPVREIPFAGHPVVGTWNALAREGVVPPPEGGTGWTRIRHEIGIGVLPVDIEFKDGAPVQVVMTQGKFEILAEVDDSHEQAEIARAWAGSERTWTRAYRFK
jgi:trans-2,3-dihydro-3-hydroxyanthranilate isomerase